jgi:RNA polymerase sigma-70 factor (ECF subfamily)
MPTDDFAQWMARVRAGDPAAAEELVRRYERAVRVAVRVRLTDPALRRLFDSADICQSVLRSFFVRAAAGQFDLNEPNDLIGLLVRMAQNKFGELARFHRRQRRDVRRAAADKLPEVAQPGPGPRRRAEGREALGELLERLGPEERELAQRRALGQTWAEIAADMGGTPQGHRMRLSRAIDRLAPELGLDGTAEGGADG